MKQANYNGQLRAALAALGVALTASHRLRGAMLALRAIGLPIACPAMPIRALLCEQLGSRLRALRYQLEHCSARNWVADCVPCDADLASLPMGTNAASLRCRFALSGLCGVALPFHDVKVRFKFRGY